MKSGYIKYFVYISLVFVVLALVQGDYLRVPQVQSPFVLAASLVLLLAGFLFEPVSWRRMLMDAGMPVSYRDSLVSTGLSVFGKYIPGKVWAVIGRAAYVTLRSGYPEHRVAMVAFNAQILVLWSGLLLGAVAFFSLESWQAWALTTVVLWGLLTVLVFTDAANRLATLAVRRVLGREVWFPRMRVIDSLRVLPLFLALWAFWCGGFLLLADALTGTALPPFVGWSFALAATLGILAIVVPGGIGVREGVLMVYLTGAGLSVQEATTIAAASRLWFLVGECMVFVASLLAARWAIRRS
jgi:glycosyltransferase 2 family protein